MDGDDLERFGWGQLDVPAGTSKSPPATESSVEPDALLKSSETLPNPFGDEPAHEDESGDADALALQDAFAHASGDDFLDDDPLDADQPPLELAVDPLTVEKPPRPPPTHVARIVERPGMAAPQSKDAEPPSPYPTPPSTWWASLPYALRVMACFPGIREEVRFASKQQRSATTARYNALVRLGRAHKAAAASGGFEDYVERAAEAESSLTSSRVQRERAQRSEQAEQEAVQARLGSALNHAHSLEIKESRLAGRVETQTQNLRRIEARVRRAEIELRNTSPDGGELPPPEETSALRDELNARTAESATAQRALRKLEDELGAIRREMATSYGLVQADQEKLDQLAREAAQMRRSRAESEAEATRGLEDALAELGLAALERSLPGTPRDALTAARAAQARFQEAEALLIRSRSRLDSWDRPAVTRGVGLALALALGAASALVIALLI